MYRKKKREWQNTFIELSIQTSLGTQFEWLCVSPAEIKRILSNLLNNAYEALSENGKIQLILENTNTHLILSLKDNGVGIPTDRINEVLNGLSLKHSGKGLGLSGAKIYMDKVGGKLTLFSALNQGTEVSLLFPKITKPTWFPEKIALLQKSHVIILDDDLSIHGLWRNRLQNYPVKILHFIKFNDAFDWCQQNLSICKEALFLVDYTLNDNLENTGLLFLEKIQAKNCGYLITSHAEEEFIQQAASEAEIKLFPKSLIGDIAVCLE